MSCSFRLYNGRMVLIVIAAIPILIVIFLVLMHVSKGSGSSSGSTYSHTKNWMDFDPGKDSNKVGDRKYPTAGIDSVMKQEFMNDLLDGDKK